MTNVYIDGDILVNKAAHAADAQKCDIYTAIQKFNDYLTDVELSAINTLKEECTFIYGLQGKDNFRYKIAQIRPYKGNRKDTKKPIYLHDLREMIIDFKTSTVVDRIETDDWLGMSAAPFKDWIMSNDKDLLQIPGNHLRIGQGSSLKMRRVEEPEALESFYRSMLTGDSADNIIGCPGIGLKKGSELIPINSTYSEQKMFDIIQSSYLDWLLKESRKTESGRDIQEIMEMRNLMVEENAALLWIQRTGRAVWTRPT